jgi:hypothetical protein
MTFSLRYGLQKKGAAMEIEQQSPWQRRKLDPEINQSGR